MSRYGEKYDEHLIKYRQDRDTFSARDKQMLARVNYKAPEEKVRTCLVDGCGRTFLSKGPYHRMCNPCRSYFNKEID